MAPSFRGRLAVAAVVSAFAIGGLAASLDGLFDSRHGPRLIHLLLFLSGPIAGVLVARALLADARIVYGIVVVIGADIGLVVGLWTRPWNFWFPPTANAMWMVACVFVAAFLGALPRRAHPVSSMPSRVILAVLLALPAAMTLFRVLTGTALFGGWPRSRWLSPGDWLVLGLFLTIVSMMTLDVWRARRDKTATPL